MLDPKLLEIQNLSVRFPVVGGVFARKIAEVRAVDGVSLTIGSGEFLIGSRPLKAHRHGVERVHDPLAPSGPHHAQSQRLRR